MATDLPGVIRIERPAATDGVPPASARRSEVAGLDALETPVVRGRPFWRRAWSATWPKVSAIAIVFVAWELVVLSGWKPTYVLPGPVDVLARLASEVGQPTLWT